MVYMDILLFAFIFNRSIQYVPFAQLQVGSCFCIVEQWRTIPGVSLVVDDYTWCEPSVEDYTWCEPSVEDYTWCEPSGGRLYLV